MPRQAREKSSTGIYHVILRGINKQIIFEDAEDYRKLLALLGEYQARSGYSLYAYCLMGNHIHLLLKEGEEGLGKIFRRLGPAYVYWYNWKYGRRGHLFQDRYRSEAVEDDSYFLTVMRYIHQNPLKAGLEESVSTYPWSSYNEYLGTPILCNTEFALNMFAGERTKARKEFMKFNQAANNDQCLEHDFAARLTDQEAVELIKDMARMRSPLEVARLDKTARDEILKQCRRAKLSLKQIERLTGVSIAIIRRITETVKE